MNDHPSFLWYFDSNPPPPHGLDRGSYFVTAMTWFSRYSSGCRKSDFRHSFYPSLCNSYVKRKKKYFKHFRPSELLHFEGEFTIDLLHYMHGCDKVGQLESQGRVIKVNREVFQLQFSLLQFSLLLLPIWWNSFLSLQHN